MALLKQAQISAVGAFSPTGSYLAAGTAAGFIDASFSSSSQLELFRLDYADASLEMPRLGSAVPATERFNRIAWGVLGIDAGTFKHGLLGSGHADGHVCLWDPSALINAHEMGATNSSDPMVTKWVTNETAVNGLDWNPFNPALLATCSGNGAVSIWDLGQDMLKPTHTGPWQSTHAQGQEGTFVQWNRHAEPILGSCYSNGCTAVWDMRKGKQIILMRDSNSARCCSALAWSPRLNTQLVVASNLETSPTLQMWDLRSARAPMGEFVGHTKGVTSVAWCPQDAGYLLSCANDHRTIVWDAVTLDALAEMPVSNHSGFEVAWSPAAPGVFLTGSYDSTLKVCNVLAMSRPMGSSHGVTADFGALPAPSKPLSRAPAWLKRPCTAAFGFGGRLAAARSHPVPQPSSGDGTGPPPVQTAVSISHVVTDSNLVDNARRFEELLCSSDPSALRTYCGHMAASHAGEEAETWSFLQVLFEDNPTQQLLVKLGLEHVLPKPEPAAAGALDATAAAAENLASAMQTQMQMGAANAGGMDFFNQAAEGHGSDFFDSLHSPPTAASPRMASMDSDPPVMPVADGGGGGGGGDLGMLAEEPDEADLELERSTQQALFVGNYTAAVDACLKGGRMADALCIAHAGGEEMFRKTMKKYIRRSSRPYLRIVEALMENDFASFIKARPVSGWKETLAILTTYCQGDHWCQLCDVLAQRLASSGLTHPATLCFIAANNMDGAVQQWAAGLKGVDTPTEQLQAVLEKAVVLLYAPQSSGASSQVISVVGTYAEALAAQGQMSVAMNFLSVLRDVSSDIAVLQDRIFHSGVDGLAHNVPPPAQPFTPLDVRPGAAAASAGGYAAAATASAPAASVSSQGSGYPAMRSGATTPAVGYGTATSAGYSGYSADSQHYAAAQGQAAAGYGAAAPPKQPSLYRVDGAYSGTASTASPYPQFGGTQPVHSTPPAYGMAAGAAPAPALPAGGGSGGFAAAAPATTAERPQMFMPSAAAPAPVQPAARAYTPSTGRSPSFPSSPLAASNDSAAPAAATAPRPSMFVPAAQPQAHQHQPATPAIQPHAAAAAAPAAATAPAQKANFFTPVAAQQMSAQPAAPVAAAPAAPVAPPPVAAGVPPPAAAAAAPPQPAPAPPPKPTGPPADVRTDTVDTSSVAAEAKPVVATLVQLFSTVAAAAPPVKKREMDDTNKRLGVLLWKLNAAQVAPVVVGHLQQLASLIDRGELQAAWQIQVQLTASDWDECGTWLTALKRLLKAAMQMQH